MKLIIDIPEGDYLWIKNHVMTINESRIANGIPLDKIRAEVLSIGGYGEYRELMPYSKLEKVLEIIDEYGKEQE